MLEILVQTATGTSSLGNTTVTFSNNTVNGNSIIVIAGNTSASSGNVSGITDTQGNTYTKDFDVANSLIGNLEVWHSSGIAGGAAPTLTITYTSGLPSAVIAREYYGTVYTNMLDKQSTNTGSGTTLSSGNTSQLVQNYELLIGAGLMTLGNTFTAGPPFVNLATLNAPSVINIATEDLMVASGGIQSATFGTNVSSQWAAGIASFFLLPTGTTTSTSFTTSTSISSTSISSTSSSISTTSHSTSMSSTSTSQSSTSSSTSSTSSSTSSTSISSTSSSTSISSTSTSISSTSISSTSMSSTSSSTSISSTSTSFSSTSSSISSTSSSVSTTSFSSTSSSSSTSTTTLPPPYLDYTYQDTTGQIVFDTTGKSLNGTTSPSWNHTVNNKQNRLLVVEVAVQGTTQGTTTAVTFNGLSMTKAVAEQGTNATAGWKNEVSIWYLFNPPVGRWTVSATVTVPTSPDVSGASQSYSNVAQTGAPDATGTATGTTVGTVTVPITTVAQNAWAIGIINFMNDGASSGVLLSSQTIRASIAMATNVNGRQLEVDTNGPLNPGSNTLTYNITPGTGVSNELYSIAAVSFAPVIIINTDLINPFNAVSYGNVSVDDGDYFIERGSTTLIREYKAKHQNNTDQITMTWKGRSTLSTLISPILIQIYNISTANWETLANQTLVPADTDFQVIVTQSTNVANYYDTNNVVTFRSYQLVV